MHITHVSIAPTEAATSAGRPALTPELLAASGARYSRNNEGLDAILAKIDPNNLDKSVDSIFRMIDYGHQSIADMAPISMFMDDISILLAYLVWSWCPTAGGQESSTRYIKLDRSGLVDPELLGLPESERAEWLAFMDDCFHGYESSLAFWEKIGTENPELSRIPRSLLDDPSDQAQKQVARMKRNYAFDRARYFLPVAAKTNMMMIMSARGWVQLCQNLLSHWLPEANLLGNELRKELTLSAPRMVKHAEAKPSFITGHQTELSSWRNMAAALGLPSGCASCDATVELQVPSDVTESDLVSALAHHDNRYAHVGAAACRTSIRFGWSAVAIAEIRDLNRHRTGQKYCPLVPVGFYCAEEQAPLGSALDLDLKAIGDIATRSALNNLKIPSAGFSAWLLLGNQFRFEHTTTLDKFVYEAELRTGTGAHYRYASHLRDAIKFMGLQWICLSEAITLGASEPE